MQITAKAKYIRLSPYKIRPLADVVRGKTALYALNWLATCAVKRAIPLQKLIESAVANAKHNNNIELSALLVKDIRIDQGPIIRYFKPGAMGRANIYRKRLSHMSVVLESQKEV